MTDVLFIQHKTTELALSRFLRNTLQVDPPLHFIYLSSFLEAKGYSVKILDMRLEKDSSAILKSLQDKPKIVGFNCMIGPQLKSLLKLSRLVKKYDPNIPVVYGGVHASFFPEMCLKEPFVDYVAIGEGEMIQVELLEAICGKKDLKDVSGLAYKRGGKIIVNGPRDYIHLDSSPVGAWHLVEKYLPFYLSDGMMRINTARGCPMRCSFCYNAKFNKKYREKSAPKVMEEIELLVNKYHVKGIRFMDDNFMANPRRSLGIAETLIAKNLNITFHIGIRISDMRDDYFSVLSKAGLISVFTGVEVGSDARLIAINKDIRMKDVLVAAGVAKKYNVRNIYSFTFGYPGESRKDVYDIIDTMEALHGIDPSASGLLEIVTPSYGSPLYEDLMTTRQFQPPDSLSGWAKLSWKNARNKPWINDPNFYEAFQLMFILAFSPRSKKSWIGLLQWWARFRIARRWVNFIPEFHLLRGLSRPFLY
ncbi:MAG: B12-binding domain-containing radical SAM protein [Candidatus Omnitrophota bacterium]|jgi:radical SAM superfamily enzyme YgiQ (UPF0313 family)